LVSPRDLLSWFQVWNAPSFVVSFIGAMVKMGKKRMKTSHWKLSISSVFYMDWSDLEMAPCSFHHRVAFHLLAHSSAHVANFKLQITLLWCHAGNFCRKQSHSHCTSTRPETGCERCSFQEWTCVRPVRLQKPILVPHDEFGNDSEAWGVTLFLAIHSTECLALRYNRRFSSGEFAHRWATTNMSSSCASSAKARGRTKKTAHQQ
jgi:hypothetical protein